MTDNAAIRNLARAKRNLNLREARSLFDQLYISDAIMLAAGSATDAAKIAGIQREHVYRMTGGPGYGRRRMQEDNL